MTAGTGIAHSEFNPSETEPVHLYQIWLFPERRGLEPSLRAEGVSRGRSSNQLRLGRIAGRTATARSRSARMPGFFSPRWPKGAK